MATSELLMSNGSAPATPASGKTKLFFNASKNLSEIDDAGRTLDFVVGPATAQSSPANPTGTNNTTGLMMGLAGSITPAFSGRIFITITGTIASTGTSIGNGGKTQIRYGTSTAPANGVALTGTAVGSLTSSVNESTTASTKQPFSVSAIVTGLTVGTAYWLDLSLAAIVAGTASVADLSISAFEI